MDAENDGRMGVLKSLVLRSKLSTIAAAIATNYYTLFASNVLSHRISQSSRTFGKLDVRDVFRKLDEEFSRYLRYGGGTAIFKGKVVLEIGTGSNLLVALRCLALGARRVITIDKFSCLRSKSDQYVLYKKFYDSLTASERKNVSRALRFSKNTYTINPAVLTYKNISAEEFDERNAVDIIISNCVFEHVFELEKTLQHCFRALTKDGLLLSYVGWPDHGLFSVYHDPLYYLEIPGWLWRLMTKHCGRVNRHHLETYRCVLADTGFSFVIAIARLKLQKHDFQTFPTALLEGKHYTKAYLARLDARKRLFAEPFRSFTDENLMVERIFIRATKTKNAAF